MTAPDLAIRPPSAPQLKGKLRVPSDKSITQRALLFGAVAEGTTTVIDALDSADSRAVRNALRVLGVGLEDRGGVLQIQGTAGRWQESSAPAVLDLENSGTGARLLLGLLAGQGVAATITGDASLCSRPMARVVDPLRTMGAVIEGDDPDRLPLTLSPRPLQPFDGCIDVASAQVKSAILLAALGARGRTEVREPGPSRDHSERMLPRFGVPVASGATSASLVGPAVLRATEVRVPADPSSAAFHAAAAALLPGSELSLTGVLTNPRRCGFFSVLQRMGARVKWADPQDLGGESVARLIVAPAPLRGVTVSPDEVPSMIDELPLVAVLGALADGETVVTGAAELKVKESDRLHAISQGLTRLGADIEISDDGFRVRGGTSLTGSEVSSFGDHRIAMSLTVAALRARGETTLRGADAVAVSYPGFFEDLGGLLGADLFSPADRLRPAD